MRYRRFALTLLAALPAVAEPPTFNKQIAPIVFEYCAPCHRPGEAAPFPLLTYKDVKRQATQMVAVTRRRNMPPWPPEPGYGEFAGTRRLTEHQIATIAEWVKAGAPEGDGKDLPPAPKFAEGWQLGPPDLIVTLPRAYRLAASGKDVFRNFIVPVPGRETQYVRALELRPGNKRIVHHANIVIDRAQTLRARDGKDGQPGFPGMDVITESRGEFDPESHFLFWKPGSPAVPEPDDMAWKLTPGTDLILNMHLQPSGKEESLQPVVGLYFTDHPPTRFPMLLQLEHDGAIDVPPGSTDTAVTDRLTLPVAVQVLGVYPHAHYIGKTIDAWATLPGGERRPLIRINDWDINWQGVYLYRQPLRLPKGTVVEMKITYDNSERNPRNPNRPPRRVVTGDRSEDEMGHVWLQVLPEKAEERLLLQEAVMRRRLEKYPADFVAHFNLAAALEEMGREKEAVPLYERAAVLRPDSAVVHNNLGAAYLASERGTEAVREFREAVRCDGTYADARYNLATALARQGELAASLAEFEVYLRARPDDAQALSDAGAVALEADRLDIASARWEAAVKLRPDDADLWTNVGTLRARQGNLREAILAFQQALRLNPNHAVALENLNRARAALR
jgi:tetratricopeptide (TPR) repeat protein/mono/diheme cytochrome c family protein